MEFKPLTDEELWAMPTVEDRVRALLLEGIQRNMYTDPIPRNVPHAAYAIRTKAGLSARGMAERLAVAHTSLSRLEGGSSKGTPSLLRRLGDEAAHHGMNNTADYLRAEAGYLENEIRTRGGKR